MKRILLIAAALLVAAAASAQSWWKVDAGLEAALREDLTRSGSNHCPYTVGDLRDTPPPAGFKPFYISHYGRHGSRHSWGDSYYQLIIGVLQKADSLGIITPAGREVLAQTREVNAAWDGMDGRLSQRGVRELSEIGHRMVRRFPQVFRGAPKIRAISSTVQRCIISMNAMTTAVAADRPRVRWTLDTGERFMDYISDTGTKLPLCRTLASGYKEHLWDAPCDSLQLLGVLFTDTAAGRRLIPSLDRFHKAMFRTATISDCSATRFTCHRPSTSMPCSSIPNCRHDGPTNGWTISVDVSTPQPCAAVCCSPHPLRRNGRSARPTSWSCTMSLPPHNPLCSKPSPTATRPIRSSSPKEILR